MGEWWNETDERRPKWWRYAPPDLIPPARRIHLATKALRWEDVFPSSDSAFVDRPVYRRLADLWNRIYFSRDPVTGLLPPPPTWDELDHEINECARAMQAHQRSLSFEDPAMNRLTEAQDALELALALWPDRYKEAASGRS
jgi:hypothetical protein